MGGAIVLRDSFLGPSKTIHFDAVDHLAAFHIGHLEAQEPLTLARHMCPGH